MIPANLIDELRSQMSLTRLSKTGLFRRIEVEDIDPETHRELLLYRAVLDQALIDYFSVVDKIRKDVERWLKPDNPDFIESCERAALDPSLVLKTFHSMRDILKGQNARFRLFGEGKPEQQNEK